jgi:hypothetical protein
MGQHNDVCNLHGRPLSTAVERIYFRLLLSNDRGVTLTTHRQLVSTSRKRGSMRLCGILPQYLSTEAALPLPRSYCIPNVGLETSS